MQTDLNDLKKYSSKNTVKVKGKKTINFRVFHPKIRIFFRHLHL